MRRVYAAASGSYLTVRVNFWLLSIISCSLAHGMRHYEKIRRMSYKPEPKRTRYMGHFRSFTSIHKGPRVVMRWSCNCDTHVPGSNPGEKAKVNLWSRRLVTIIISRFARFLPTQLAGPNEKGMKALGSWTSFSEEVCSPSAINHLSGQKDSG